MQNYITLQDERIRLYNCHTFPVERLGTDFQFKDNNSRKKRKYRLEFGTFDIETTSHIDSVDDGALDGYGYMYIWQFCSADTVCMGRAWDDFIVLLRRINLHYAKSGTHAIFAIYVHNLSFEAAFMLGALTMGGYHYDIFAIKNRKVLTIRLKEIEIEFRCSYKLTNRSLAKLLSDFPDCGYAKMTGDLNYKIERTPLSELAETELGYCVVDVLGLYRALKLSMKQTNDNVATIPLTSTGYIRRRLKEATKGNRSYKNLIAEMALTPEQYKLVRRLCKGGDTLASMSHPVGTILHDGDSYDIKSSYPCQLTTKKYPYGKLRLERNVDENLIKEIEEDGDYYITEIMATNVRLKNPIQPIPCVTCATADYIASGPGRVEYNGRLLCADEIIIAFDMPSFQLFREQYNYDEIIFGETYSCEYRLLPKEFRDFVIEVFRGKCELEYKIKYAGLPEEEVTRYKQDYALYKGLLNGIFGMCYTNPLHDEYTYLPDEYRWEEPKQADLDDPKTQKKLWKNQLASVAPYLWGVHTASMGRIALDELINTVGWYNTWYCDTDSDKCKYSPEIRARVEKLNEEKRRIAKELGAHVNVNGIDFYLGVIECETEKDRIQEFVTQGAKKYCYRDSTGLHMTLSGVEKKQVAQLKDDIRNFVPGFLFDPAGGITMHYIDGAPHVQHVKGDDGTECDIWLASNVVATDRIITLGSILDGTGKLKARLSELDELIEMSQLIDGEELGIT